MNYVPQSRMRALKQQVSMDHNWPSTKLARNRKVEGLWRRNDSRNSSREDGFEGGPPVLNSRPVQHISHVAQNLRIILGVINFTV